MLRCTTLEQGIQFDRGTTYFNAVYSKTGPSALERFLSEVKAPGGAIEIGLERSKEGQAMIEQVVARERLGAVDQTLSAKVRLPVRLCACVTRLSRSVATCAGGHCGHGYSLDGRRSRAHLRALA